MMGFFAILLFLLWLTPRLVFKSKPPKTTVIQELKGRSDHAKGSARDLEEPGVEELPDVQEPQLADTLQAMTDAISTQKASFEAFEGNADAVGKGKGQGDSRQSGPGGEGNLDVVPPWERWEIRFTAASADDYAKQLDDFSVELGAIPRNRPNIDYVRNVSKSPILYFIHPPNDPLLQFSIELLGKVNVSTEGKFVAQFYSDEAFNQLLALEKSNLGGRSLADVRKTVFGVRTAGGSNEFFLIRQDFRPGT